MTRRADQTPFRVVDFLILMLKTQGEAMKRLSDLFSEDILVEAIERREARLEAAGLLEEPSEFKIGDDWIFDSCPEGGTGAECYGELEAEIRGVRFAERVEFYLWSYPHYRGYIESSIDLAAKISDPASQASASEKAISETSGPVPVPMIEEAVEKGLEWLDSLQISEPFATQMKKHVAPVWTSFRSEALKRLGRNPLKRV